MINALGFTPHFVFTSNLVPTTILNLFLVNQLNLAGLLGLLTTLVLDLIETNLQVKSEYENLLRE